MAKTPEAVKADVLAKTADEIMAAARQLPLDMLAVLNGALERCCHLMPYPNEQRLQQAQAALLPAHTECQPLMLDWDMRSLRRRCWRLEDD
jgi:hypothetical protein